MQSTHLTVVADLENGFGDQPEFIAETIRLVAAAGLVGGSIEDSTGDEENPIYDFDFAVARVTAAVGALRALDFPSTLAARAENFLHGRADLDDTIHRLKAFEKTGADVLFTPGLPNFDAIRMVCASLSRPVNVIANGAFNLILLRHKRLCCAGCAVGAAQHGHRGRLLTRARTSRRRMVATGFGMWRSGRSGGASV